MGAKYTEAQRRATDKYNKTLKNISIRVKPDQYNIYKEYAYKNNMSLRELIMIALDHEMQQK